MFLVGTVLLIVVVALTINKAQYGDYLPPQDDDDL